MEPYEQYTRRGGEIALREIDGFFAGTGRVHQTLRRLAVLLQRGHIQYGVCGAMALNAHGYRRATIDVDVALAVEDVAGTVDYLVTHDFDRVERLARSVRDRRTAVRVDLFAEPNLITVAIDGISYQSLAQLLETKLVVGLARPGWMKHLGDVVETIKALRLPLDFSAALREDVRPKFEEYWQAVQDLPEEF